MRVTTAFVLALARPHLCSAQVILSMLVLSAGACMAVPPVPPPPPLVERAPVEGHVLTLEVLRVPEGAEWAKIESDCARGIWEAGDIKLVDRRGDPDREGEPCFRMRWLNGLPLGWEGCGELYWPDQPRYRYFRVLGLQAARAIVGTDRGRSGYLACVVGKAGWYDEACTLASQAIKWGRGQAGRESSGEILADAMPGLPPDWQVKLHDRILTDTIEAMRRAQGEGDRFVQHHASLDLVALGEHMPRGSSSSSFVRRVRDAGVLDVKNLAKVLQKLRPALVAERAYADALEGDPDPVGEYLGLASTSDLVTGAAGLVPSALIPAPSTATAAEKWAVKRATLEEMYEMQRKDGLLLYEALVGAGRVADAERLQRELKSRYLVPPIPQGDSEEDVALRRLLKDVLPPGDLDSRLRAAEKRAKGKAPPSPE